uniref:Uncharacterized protein n=2 Tax=Aegilops tauschii subsp. strangulata TaxID=200361 RepID=A0A453CQR7_AEGTS
MLMACWMNKIDINETKCTEGRGWRDSSAEREAQTCRESDILQGAPKRRQGIELDKLPEDMLHHIHSLMPVKDAGRAACVSKRFLHSWRCYSNLKLNKRTLGLIGDKFEGNEIYHINKVDQILNSYSKNGMKVKSLKLDLFHCSSASAFHLDRWLRIALKSESSLTVVPSFHLSLAMSRGLPCCPMNVNTPMLPDKLLHLKSLKIVLNGSGPCSPVYDTFSLASFLDASPALESFILRIERNAIIHYYDAGGDAYPRGKPAYQHDHLKRVMIAGFRSAKSLIKLVIHILESAPSLECLTLDTTPGGHGRKLGDTSICSAARMWGKCCYMSERALEEANRAVEAASRYIIGRVPSTVEFEVLEPCRQCRTGNQ